ncbi:hypothetical protein TruAng_007618 [Truncatella angustata]|nr:hypothetical protein TruAng_007618 [Truncatella angustata]
MDSPMSDQPDLEKGLSRDRLARTGSAASSQPSLQAESTPSVPTRFFNRYLWMKEKRTLDPVRKPQHRKLISQEKSYRKVATFLDSDENFMIYRRFGYLHARMLLRLQDKLRVLESLLDDYDDEDASDETQKQLLMSRDLDEAACKKLVKQEPGTQTRTQILDEIETNGF